jgi:SAM-dependent methyltransferase
MSAPEPVNADPRWGSDQRDAKADAIWHTMLQQCGPQVAEGIWLDLGCGSGGIAVALAPKVRRMIGIDPEPWQRWAEYEARYSNLTFHSYDGDSHLPADLDEAVDVVICNQVYEHVANPHVLLADIVRVLKPGGHCYFAGPNLLWPVEPHVYWPFVHWLPRSTALRLMTMLGSSRTGDLDAWSVSYWRLAAWFQRHGLRHVNAIHSRLRADPMSASMLLRLAARLPRWCIDLLAPLSPGFVFVLEKPATEDD